MFYEYVFFNQNVVKTHHKNWPFEQNDCFFSDKLGPVTELWRESWTPTTSACGAAVSIFGLSLAPIMLNHVNMLKPIFLVLYL